MRTTSLVIVLCALFAAAPSRGGFEVPLPAGMEVGPTDFRISTTGTDGDNTPVAIIPAVAYNSTNHQFLVVWQGDPTGIFQPEVYGQRINAATGAEIGSDFRISDMGPDGNANYKVSDLAVTYNATSNEYLVVWRGDDNTAPLVDNEHEIFGQRINGATGAETGTNDFRISNMGTNGSTAAVADVPWVVWNSTNNQYLVVWRGHDGDEEFEIWGQRLDQTGAELGVDFRISDAGADGDIFRLALDPKAAHNSVNNEYLVVWQADDLATDNEVEVFGQRLNGATGAEVGTNDFRISDMGPETNTNYRGEAPAVAYNPIANEYLVVFWGSDPAFMGSEVIGQRINGATGAEIAPNDFLISSVGPADSDLYNVGFPSVAFSPIARRYLVIWAADDNQGTAVDNEFETYGQVLSMTGGSDGPDDFRISNMGPDTDPLFQTADAEVALASNGMALVVWRADDDTGDLVDDEHEIFGQLYQVFVRTGEMNLDSQADIVLRNYATGQNAVWRMDATDFVGVSDLPSLPNVNYRNEATADFTGDGKFDLLWRNMSTGQNAIWRMNGLSYTGTSDLPLLANTSYHFEGAADFNSNGSPDVILRNYATGQNALWLLKGVTFQSIVDLPALPNVNWRIEGTGDFNGDNNPDIVLRNYSTGQNAIWRMNGTALQGISDLPTLANVNYRIDAIADYDADGDPDIVWRNYSSGQNAIWLMNGTTFSAVSDLPAVVTLSIEIAGPK